ncbi:MAG: hypothetical protein LBM00_05970 [Deltaproteobacteria bacterium]|jgi:hypothetical protein|nr:hypothetical protein [Deltaproteobacteria bacterium]
MWNLTSEHCCATCEYSEETRSDRTCDYTCQLLLDAIESGVALAVYVDCASRCSCYECDENKFFAIHGYSHADCLDPDELLLPGQDYPASFRRFDALNRDC